MLLLTRHTLWRFAALAGLCTGLGLTSIGQAETLTVECKGLHANQGYLQVKLFTLHDSFPNGERIFAKQTRRVKSNPMRVVFPQVPEGIYAIQAFQDLDGDGERDTTIAGASTDPVGYSNQARKLIGAPDFNDAAIVIGDDESMLVTITLD